MPPPKSKGGKMLGLINWRLKVTINDGRALTGQMLAFDRHMNLVLADCEEFRRTPAEQEMKRTLGLVILRGETVVSLSVEGPPPVVDEDKKNVLPVGPGRGMPAGRGMGMMPPMGVPPMGRPPMPFAPPGMPGPPPGFRPPGFPPGAPFPPPGFGGPPPPGY
ncbi:Sm-like ribonucleoprotein [Suillus cothurnatus]|nr:Sm-like ribonucleoprotein [Suillus cothurnatus]